LFHRLNVIRLRLPPLRERREDIPLLARHFLQKSARELGGEPKRLGDDAVRALQAFDWPGNVRQLENACHWLTVMAPMQDVGAKDLPPESRDAVGAPAPLTDAARGPEPLPEAAVTTTAGAAGVTPTQVQGAGPSVPLGLPVGATSWSQLLEREVSAQLAAQPAHVDEGAHSDLMDRLAREFEGTIIRAALRHTRGRRIDAALRLGIGRNTITRKIQELRLDDEDAPDGSAAKGRTGP